MAVAFMLSWSYGFPRIMSSFAFQNSDTGPPHDEEQNILSVPVREDHTCGNGWVCEHRWRQIYNMVAFRNIVRGTTVKNWWDNRSKQIAFCRGNKGFIAFNDEHNTDFRQHLQGIHYSLMKILNMLNRESSDHLPNYYAKCAALNVFRHSIIEICLLNKLFFTYLLIFKLASLRHCQVKTANVEEWGDNDWRIEAMMAATNLDYCNQVWKHIL
uniref:Alpha-amylase/branching enzyme C-terminal all beta domain-containing protein n=1 Tax=Timema shepardi TaxID=629360 RepID=A0A7R9B6J6_TIMSH|nr:unnamed protein product [Timema shepardi]